MASEGGRRYILFLSLGALGIVYGDIGTSPLYAFREAFVAADGLTVTRESVLGILSMMCWALFLIVSVKYLLFVMRADNDGEGGILALTALIAPVGKSASKGFRRSLILIGLFGTALLYGDGMITPAISVLAAVEGLEIAAPGLERFVVPVSIAILMALFSIQRRGTAKVGALFGPVMILWFSVLALLGVAQIIREPGVLVAVNPVYALRFAVNQPGFTFKALGAVFLVVTGSEALYADMGHFGKRPIRLGWFLLVLPALLINYLGQGALLLRDPTAVANPFYRMPPAWALLPMVILATAATVIASQALISGAFSLTTQAVQLGYLPRVRIDHTSPREFGQVYIPVVNWILMVACIGLVVAFESSTNLAAAYGVAVTTTMIITTALLFVVMRERWGWSRVTGATVGSLFLVVDGLFFSANIVKIPAGGWFPLVAGGAVFAVMTTWKRGRDLVTAQLRRAELPVERFIASIAVHKQQRVPGTAVYLYSEPGATPPALLTNLRHNEVLHETVAIVSVVIEPRPRVMPAGRSNVHSMGEDFHQIGIRFGFFEPPDVPKALSSIVHPDFGLDPTDAVYVIGRETVVAAEHPAMARWRAALFRYFKRNAASASDYFHLPPEQVIEVGSQVEV
ncbi:MAG: potassium transporter Kup [Acidimicrobiia bacterium]|nr:potassium transporter Kup [Acidimicrobiia bacterium]